MSRRELIVLKFGSSVLRTSRDLDAVVSEIYRHVREGRRVIAVVSAIGRTTDRLLSRARAIDSRPDETSLAALLATGELRSAALLHLALCRDGVSVALFDHLHLGLRTTGDRLHATPAAIDRAAILAALADHDVVVAPGFVGVHGDGQTSLLGRGGSDLTAIVLADRLAADRCVLIKDVDGLYERDPNRPACLNGDPRPRRFAQVTFGQALALESGLVQDEAIAWARQANRPFEIASLNSQRGTIVGAGADRLEVPAPAPGRRRVALLGCGHVGREVYERIAARGAFEVVGVAVRRLKHHHRLGDVPQRLLCRADELLRRRPDILIELCGGTEPAATIIEAALHQGCHFVTANKALIVRHGRRLAALAARHDVRLCFSAAAGGGAPMLEAVARMAAAHSIRRISGVLNGTVAFILDAIGHGIGFSEAVAEARERGLAEADVSADLSGLDAAHKVVLLARAAFGIDLSPEVIERQPVDAALAAGGGRLHQVASCTRRGNRIEAAIRLQSLAPDDPLLPRRCAGNTLLIECDDGAAALVRGIGAGGPPTAVSVLADLLDIQRCAAHAADAGSPPRPQTAEVPT